MKTWSLLLVLPAACWLSSLAGAEPAQRPNILFIAIDDMNDWTGFLGGHPQAKTPHMDALAAKGVSFTNAHTAAPGCSPSRNALLLGKQPFTTGLYPFYRYEVFNSVFKNDATLPEHLKKNGYATFGSGKVHHGHEKKEATDAHDEWTDYGSVGKRAKLTYAPEKGYQVEGAGNTEKMGFYPITSPMEDWPEYQIAQYGVDVLKRTHDAPFFLAVGFNKPHLPFVCPQKFFDLYPGPITAPPIKPDDLTDMSWAARSNAKLEHELRFTRDDAWEKVRRAYLACISATDENVGTLLDALAASPYAANTIVVLWSDHGFHLGEKRSFTKFSLWEESTRVPFIIYDPRLKSAAASCAEPVSLVDIFPTLCELTGVPVKAGLDGESLVPWLKNPALPKQTPAITTWGRGNYSIRTRDWRYSRYFDGTEELYDHKSDPREWINLADRKEFADQKKQLAVFLPKKEAPLIREFKLLHNVVDADQPSLANFMNLWKRANQELRPPLDRMP